MASRLGKPKLSKTDRLILQALGWTAQMIARFPAHAALVLIAFRYRPWMAFQLTHLIIRTSFTASWSMLKGTSRIVAPKTSARVANAVTATRTFVNPLPSWLETGSKLAKRSFVGSVVGTGISVVADQYRKAEAGEFGTSEVYGDAVSAAEFNMEGNVGYQEDMRPVRMHRLGGPGRIIV